MRYHRRERGYKCQVKSSQVIRFKGFRPVEGSLLFMLNLRLDLTCLTYSCAAQNHVTNHTVPDPWRRREGGNPIRRREGGNRYHTCTSISLAVRTRPMDGGMANTACYYTQAVNRQGGGGRGYLLPPFRLPSPKTARDGVFIRLPKSSQEVKSLPLIMSRYRLALVQLYRLGVCSRTV